MMKWYGYKKIFYKYKRKRKILSVNRKLNNIFFCRLFNSCDALLFLHNRGLCFYYIIKKFSLGYCNGFNISIFKNKYVDNMKHLIHFSKLGNLFLLSNKLVIPLFSNNNIIGFIGRSIYKNSKLRYVFTKSNFYFNKLNYLYYIYDNIKSIIKKKYLYVVEGCFDLLSMFKIGIKNVVSILGCFLSFLQLKRILGFSDNIFFLFDGDDPGKLSYRNIVIKYYRYLLKKKYYIHFIFLHTSDPSSLISKDIHLFFNKINSSITLEEYILINNCFTFKRYFKKYFFCNYFYLFNKINLFRIEYLLRINFN